MRLFQDAFDYYGFSKYQQLLGQTVLLAVTVVLCFAGLHLLRRAAGYPLSSDNRRKLEYGLQIKKYELGARLFHWANLLFITGLAISGLALFAPTALGRAPWLLLHELFAAAFVAALLLHVVVAPQRGDARTMWFDARDWRDLKLTAANFLGRTRKYPSFGKYDPWQKLYHALLTLLSVVLIFSGTFLVLSAQVWATFSHNWMRAMRLLHDVASCCFVAIIVGHIYFGIIRVNWPQLAAMITGRLSSVAFNRYHDASRWQPHQQTNQRQTVE
jgi:Ni/Fe-hydrogenase 1 B-type cytochrome subunit